MSKDWIVLPTIVQNREAYSDPLAVTICDLICWEWNWSNQSYGIVEKAQLTSYDAVIDVVVFNENKSDLCNTYKIGI